MLQLQGTWLSHLKSECDKPYFKALSAFVQSEYAEQSCYPPIDQLFNAFNSCPFEAIRVVIIGQDPYHGEGQANGLCFSVNGPSTIFNQSSKVDNRHYELTVLICIL